MMHTDNGITRVSDDRHDYEAFRLLETLYNLKRLTIDTDKRMNLDDLFRLGHMHPTYQRYAK